MAGLLATLRPCFTAPSFRTFTALVAGLIGQPGRRTVTGMLTGAGLAAAWHHSRAHWFFSHARWSADQVGLAVAGLVVRLLIPAGAPLLVAVDDTLFRRSGRRVHGAAWCHDGAGATRTGRAVAWGNCWVIAGLVLRLPFTDRPVCLPVLARLWRKDGPTKQVIAGQLVTALAAAVPGRVVHVVADAWYAGADGAPGAARGGTRDRGGFPAGVSLTSRLRGNAVLTGIATGDPGSDRRRGGRPRRIGARLGTPAQLAATADWTTAQVHRYGRTDTVALAEIVCLWYGAYRSRTIRVILVRDPDRPTGYQLALLSTDLTSSPAEIVERYAARWSIEVAIEDAKQITGVGQARNRVPAAVERTVPFGLLAQTLVVVWYARHGDHHATVADRRAAAPWYRSKTHPAYHDMLITLRRTLITARFRAGKTRTPTPDETHAVLLAWEQAAA
ncbi:MAG TPA: transposase [Streptosporangiaceae bacterium]